MFSAPTHALFLETDQRLLTRCKTRINLQPPVLYEYALANEKARLLAGGALNVDTGIHTGRSAKDKALVHDSTTEKTVWWDQNSKLTSDQFDNLLQDFLAHAETKDLFVQDLYGGADPKFRLPGRIFTEYAWHSLFIHNLLIRPTKADLEAYQPALLILNLPSFKADPARHGTRSQTVIACDLDRRIVLIGGTSYAGEIKKSVFTVLNYMLPEKQVMPMHCAANHSTQGEVALFFGLSGTGKTTLSADPSRILIGDDEHGWGENGVFNFEGGCYAKTIRLSKQAEPEIYATTQRFGTILENVVMDPVTRMPNFDDATKTENTRCAYPIHFIPNSSAQGWAGHPKHIIMLTCDAFGVLPPIAHLTPAQAVYHFLSGYTAKVAGTEKGITEPQATFSACFGAPFMPRHPAKYGRLLKSMISKHKVKCWLVNTGWTEGPYGVGRRMPIKATRLLLAAALEGTLESTRFYTDRSFGFTVPTEIPHIEPDLLYPRKTWADPEAYDAQAAKLVGMFTSNFETFLPFVDEDVQAAAPKSIDIP